MSTAIFSLDSLAERSIVKEDLKPGSRTSESPYLYTSSCLQVILRTIIRWRQLFNFREITPKRHLLKKTWRFGVLLTFK